MKKRISRKGLAAVASVFIASIACADDVNWSGGSQSGADWSDTANWSGSALPTSSDKAVFPLAEQDIRLDADYSVRDFSVAADGTARFYNDDPTKTNTLTVTELDTLGESGATIALDGTAALAVGAAGNRVSKASVIVSGGASFTAEALDYGTFGGQKLVARGANSKIEIGSITLGTGSGNNPDETLEAYDGGSVTVTSYVNQPKKAYTIIVTNGSSIVATNLTIGSGTDYHKVTCEDSYLELYSLSGWGKDQELKVGGTGLFRCKRLTVSAAAQKCSQDLWLYGCNPRIEITDSGGSACVFGNETETYWGYATLHFAPEPTWKEGEARISRTSSHAPDNRVNLKPGVNFRVDCSGFAGYYGRRRMMLFSQKRVGDFTIPMEEYILKSGEGADCCEISFSTNVNRLAFYMTVVSTNAVPPAKAVAGVNNRGKATVFYETLAEAIESAAAAEADEEVDIVLVKRTSIGVLENPGPHPVRIYALEPVVISTGNGEVGAGIEIGENVTVQKRTGMVIFFR